MRMIVRTILDRGFTVLTAVSVILLSLVLLAVLGPMIWRGSSAVVFFGTVEFRKMQLDLFKRGDVVRLEAEIKQIENVRKAVYEMIDGFKRGIDPQALIDRARQIHRDFGEELRYRNADSEQYTQLRSIARQMRDKLEAAFESRDIEEITENVTYVLALRDDPRFKGTSVERFFSLASDFLKSAQSVDLTRHAEYARSLEETEEAVRGLFGPRPDEPLPALVQLRYGATRWDMAQQLLDKLLYAIQWRQDVPGQPLVPHKVNRAEQFKNTPLEPLFVFVQQNLHMMLRPRMTFYWQFFIDDNVNSHYFGGVGPEILGTLLITVAGMLFAIPFGVISAAYLVETASQSSTIRVIRMCINTLAGVPSVVFGIFGLAFFVLYLFPKLGLEPKGCILAASVTLAILTLPVMIRASEEAIRSVPQTYKEASLSLGASRFRTFVTVILPTALPGIMTGIILSLSRIAGETAPVLFTGAVALGPVPRSILEPTRTLSYGSYDMACGDRLSMLVPHNQYGMVVTLVALILLLNGLAIVLRAHVFRKLQGH